MSRILELLEDHWQNMLGTDRKRITHDEYQQWRDHAAWQILKGLRLGQSFCNHFNIQDRWLYYINDDMALGIIKRHYVERRTSRKNID